MTEQPTTVASVETPKRKLHVKLPARATVVKAASYLAVFGTGVLVGVKRVKAACSCEPDEASTDAVNTDN